MINRHSIFNNRIDWRSSSNENVEFLGKTNRVSAPTLYSTWPRLSSNIKMQIKGLHLVICVLVHLVESRSRRCAVTRAVRYAAIETPIFDRAERIYIPLLLLSLVSAAGRSRSTRCPSSSRRWFIMTDLETAKRRDSSTIRDDESANVPSSDAPLESEHAHVNTCLWTWKLLSDPHKRRSLSKREARKRL